MRRFRTLAAAAASMAVLALATSAAGQSDGWRTAWYAAPHPAWDEDFVLPLGAPAVLQGRTIRQQVGVNLAGASVRVTVSNRHGGSPVRLADLSVEDAPLLFGGASEVILEPGAERTSDPVSRATTRGDSLAITLRVVEATDLETLHWDGRSTARLSGGAGEPETSTLRFYLSAVQVETGRDCAAFVALGDSITDGNGVPIDQNARWTDILARRAGGVAIINAGISGARLLSDGMGEDALSRLDADVASHPASTEVFVLLGTNDIAWPGSPFEPDAPPVTLERLQEGYRLLARAARERGLRIVGSTLPPFRGALHGTPMESTYWSPQKETLRMALNAWLRQAHPFDDFVDVDVVLRDGTDPSRLDPAFDSGDHLHPGPDGNAAIASAIDLSRVASGECASP